jgi:hypothetical protein
MDAYRGTTVVVLFLLAGCGTVQSTKMDIPASRIDIPAGDPALIALQDERPADQRASSKDGDAYGEITRLGDEAVSPPGPALLKIWLSNKLSAQLKGKTVTLHEFSVQITELRSTVNGVAINNGASLAPGGFLIAPWLVPAMQRAGSRKIVGVRISGKVDEKEFFSKKSDEFQGRVSVENINSLIRGALDDATAEIEKLLASGQTH